MARNKYDVDETLKKEFNIEHIKRLAHYIRPYTSKMSLALFLRVTASAASMLSPFFLMLIIDRYIPMGQAGVPYIIGVSLLALISAFYVSVIISVKTKLMMTSGQSIIRDLRSDLFAHLQKLPFDYYDSRPHGKIQVRVVNYINNLSELLSNGIVNTLVDLISLIVIIVFMLCIDWRFTLICLCGLPFLFGIVWLVKKKQRESWQNANNKQSNMNAYIAESMNGIRITQSFVREEKNVKIFNRLSSDYRRAWLHAIKYNLILPPTVDFMSVLTTTILYVVGVYLISHGSDSMSVGKIIAFSGYIVRFWTPITNLGSFYNSLLTAIAYLEMIFETIDEPLIVEDRRGAVKMPPIKGKVEFRDVCFSYEDAIPILKHLNFIANPGSMYAIVGPTGAGKTTIVNLLSRFYNLDSGQILIDDIDIETVTIASLREQMGVMLQDSFLFAGTIRENIRYGNRNASDQEVERAAKVVCAHHFIQNLSNGYDTMVNERGSRLSVGQRQLIAFARALLADPAILILDEATSSIDTETEIYLQEGLMQLLKERTSFIIAHRLSTIRNADCILYVDDGVIKECGDHETLMQRKGLYYNMYKSQFDFLRERVVG